MADRFRHAETVEDSIGGIRDNLWERDRLATIPPDRFLSISSPSESSESAAQVTKLA